MIALLFLREYSEDAVEVSDCGADVTDLSEKPAQPLGAFQDDSAKETPRLAEEK